MATTSNNATSTTATTTTSTYTTTQTSSISTATSSTTTTTTTTASTTTTSTTAAAPPSDVPYLTVVTGSMELNSSNPVDPQIAKDALVGSIAELVDVDRKLVELTKFTVRPASASLRMASRRLSQDPNVLAEYRITLPEERPDGVTGETIKAALEQQDAAVRLAVLLSERGFVASVAFLSAPKVEYVRRQPPGQSGAVSAAVIGASLGGAVVFLGLVAVVSHSAWRRSKARSGGAREAACRGAAAS
eukprot:CAMPEP_0198495650 /NCGR_PEP_ID=MMETSP1462-20131121/5329_1 /TAXON_ID=1333877 /ORGANISM="Brandtodinium nutriculum, Strain RCC3387" /LENGTH=245 /DNA_ID=CAMNT_0044224443 /DNA_START=148 /DNA_END=881 /DNA_ORIENTATION=+